MKTARSPTRPRFPRDVTADDRDDECHREAKREIIAKTIIEGAPGERSARAFIWKIARRGVAARPTRTFNRCRIYALLAQHQHNRTTHRTVALSTSGRRRTCLSF